MIGLIIINCMEEKKKEEVAKSEPAQIDSPSAITKSPTSKVESEQKARLIQVKKARVQ